MDEIRARCQVSLQAIPIEAEVRAYTWIVRYAEVVFEKEFIDGFHKKKKGGQVVYANKAKDILVKENLISPEPNVFEPWLA